MTPSFTRKEWDNVFNELVRVTKPGGWIECFEYDFELYRPGPRSKQILAEREYSIYYIFSRELPESYRDTHVLSSFDVNQKQSVKSKKSSYLAPNASIDLPISWKTLKGTTSCYRTDGMGKSATLSRTVGSCKCWR